MLNNGLGRSMSRLSVIALFGLLLLLLTPVRLFAQSSTATLDGTVKDATGAVVPGAKVVVVQTETNFTSDVQTKDDGFFRFSTLPLGPYTLRVSRDGFQGYEQTGLVLTVGQSATVQVALSVGSSTQEVTVLAGTPAIDSTSSTIQTVIDEAVVEGLPLNGRNPAALVFTAPGVTDALLNPKGSNANVPVAPGASLLNESAPTANGVRPGGTYFSLDGATNVDPLAVVGGPFPNPDATQEFSVVTGSYGARYVSAPGGAVNIVTRSGTNAVHGSVFEFIRNGAANARNNFTTSPDTLKRNQYGFAAGGPILKNRLFIFGSYEQTAIRAQNLINVNVGLVSPNENQQKGQFKQTATGNIVQLPLSKVATNLLKYIPPPNFISNGLLQNYNSTSPLKTNDPQGVVKADFNIGNHRLFARYFTDRLTIASDPMAASTVTTSGFNALTASQGQAGAWNAYAIGDTWLYKNFVIDGRASYISAQTSANPDPSLSKLDLVSLGATGVTIGAKPTLSTFYALGSFIVAGGANGTGKSTSNDYSLNVLRSVGKHEVDFGTDFRFIHYTQSDVSGQNPQFLFLGLHTQYLGPGALDNNALADFVEGYPYLFLQGDGSFQDITGHLFGLYAQDKYRATNKLTLTGGLRWDPYLPYTPANGHIDCFKAGQQSKVYTNAPLGLIYPGDPNCSSAGTSAKYNIIQPRFGFAYQLDSKGNTALRGGYGMYSTQFQLVALDGFVSPPFTRNFLSATPVSFENIDSPWASNGKTDPFAGGFQNATYQPPANVSFANAQAIGFTGSAIDSNFRPAYVQQYSLSLQQALSRSDSVELAYIGTQSVHIAQSYDANLPVYNPATPTTLGTRPYGSEGITQLLTLVSNSTANYHGMNLTFRHHGGGGLDLVSAFNWSKCLDDGSTPPTTSGIYGATGLSNNQVTNGAYLPRARRGRCDFDQNLTSRTTAVWNLPALKGSNKLVQGALGSWSITGLVVADAGQPFSVTDGAGNSQTGLGLDLANSVSGVPTYVNGKLNAKAFTGNAPGTYGNLQRNSFRAPKYVHIDPAVMKNVTIYGDKLRLQLRAEAFNVFNHPNFIQPASDINAPSTFGQTTAARDPRILQISAKILF